MIIIPDNFSAEKFVERYGVGDGEWSVVGKTGELVCPSLPDLTTADIDDCVMDALTPKLEWSLLNGNVFAETARSGVKNGMSGFIRG